MGNHLSKKDYKYFDMARKVAESSDFKNFKLGCVIVHKNKVISTGYNSKKTSPVQKKYNKYRHFNHSDKPVNHSLHAEISALINIPKCVDVNLDYRQVSVYIYRISTGKRLNQGLSRPCEGCLRALRDKGVRTILYTTDDGFCKEELF